MTLGFTGELTTLAAFELGAVFSGQADQDVPVFIPKRPREDLRLVGCPVAIRIPLKTGGDQFYTADVDGGLHRFDIHPIPFGRFGGSADRRGDDDKQEQDPERRGAHDWETP